MASTDSKWGGAMYRVLEIEIVLEWFIIMRVVGGGLVGTMYPALR